MANLTAVIRQLKAQRDRAVKEVSRLDAALAALNGAGYRKRTGMRRALSAAARKRIAKAQRERWLKWRKARAAKS